jgi:broad specificity phosphatase PhoE
MELYLIRHAQSTNNILPDERPRTMDPLLTELGVRQAERVAEHLARRLPLADGTPTRLYCSAMWRALHTAHCIARATGLTPEVWVDIHEHGGIYLEHCEYEGEDAGCVVGYPGLTRSAILAAFPGTLLPPEVTEAGWWHGGREELADCYERAARVIEALRPRMPGRERLLMVSHGGFLNSFLKILFDQSLEWPIFYHHANTAITHLRFSAEGYLDVHYVNRVDHLPPEMVT